MNRQLKPPSVQEAIYSGDTELCSLLGRIGGKKSARIRKWRKYFADRLNPKPIKPLTKKQTIAYLHSAWPRHEAEPEVQHFLAGAT